MSPSAAQIKTVFETLTPASLPALVALYTPQARFKDPFNDVTGSALIEAVFSHMFTQVREPRFVVTRVIESDASQDVFMRWDFYFVSGNTPQHIHGSTHFERDAAGLITLHRDYWDAAQELYEKIPLLGWILRFIRRRLAVIAK
jgi:steroid Delta-isomerase